jgi:hypothetical protein
MAGKEIGGGREHGLALFQVRLMPAAWQQPGLS